MAQCFKDDFHMLNREANVLLAQDHTAGERMVRIGQGRRKRRARERIVEDDEWLTSMVLIQPLRDFVDAT